MTARHSAPNAPGHEPDTLAPSYLLIELERVTVHGFARDDAAEAYLFRLGYVLELPDGHLTLTAAGIAARRADR